MTNGCENCDWNFDCSGKSHLAGCRGCGAEGCYGCGGFACALCDLKHLNHNGVCVLCGNTGDGITLYYNEDVVYTMVPRVDNFEGVIYGMLGDSASGSSESDDSATDYYASGATVVQQDFPNQKEFTMGKIYPWSVQNSDGNSFANTIEPDATVAEYISDAQKMNRMFDTAANVIFPGYSIVLDATDDTDATVVLEYSKQASHHNDFPFFETPDEVITFLGKKVVPDSPTRLSPDDCNNDAALLVLLEIDIALEQQRDQQREQIPYTFAGLLYSFFGY